MFLHFFGTCFKMILVDDYDVAEWFDIGAACYPADLDHGKRKWPTAAALFFDDEEEEEAEAGARSGILCPNALTGTEVSFEIPGDGCSSPPMPRGSATRMCVMPSGSFMSVRRPAPPSRRQVPRAQQRSPPLPLHAGGTLAGGAGGFVVLVTATEALAWSYLAGKRDF